MEPELVGEGIFAGGGIAAFCDSGEELGFGLPEEVAVEVLAGGSENLFRKVGDLLQRRPQRFDLAGGAVRSGRVHEELEFTA